MDCSTLRTLVRSILFTQIDEEAHSFYTGTLTN